MSKYRIKISILYVQCTCKFDKIKNEEYRPSSFFLSTVIFRILCQTWLTWRAINFIRIWLLSCVRFHMLTQTWFSRKRRVTNFTGIWLLCVCSHMRHQTGPIMKRKSYMLHNNMASLLCVFAYELLKQIYEKIKSHIFHKNMDHLFCAFVDASPKLVYLWRKCHTLHKDNVYLWSVFSYVPSSSIHVKMNSNNIHKNMAYHPSESSYDTSNLTSMKTKSHILHKNVASLVGVFVNAPPRLIFGKMKNHTVHIKTVYLQCWLVSFYLSSTSKKKEPEIWQK